MDEHNRREGDNWYSNKDIYEMVQGLGKELQETRSAIKKYNGLHEVIAKACLNIADVDKRLLSIEQQALGKYKLGEIIRQWGGWLLAVLTFWYAFGRVGG